MSVNGTKPVAGGVGIVTVCLDPLSLSGFQEIVTGLNGVRLAGSFQTYSVAEREQSLTRALENYELRVCLVNLDHNCAEALHAIERLHRALGRSMAIFATSQQAEPELIIATMRAGCTEYLRRPLQREAVVEALLRLESKEKDMKQATSAGRVITLIGTKGGTGVTALAVHFAQYLVRVHKRKCVLVDQHPCVGDVSLYLGLNKHQYNFFELASNTDRLDRELLQGFVVHDPSGLDVIDSPDDVEFLQNVPISAVESTVDFLRGQYECVLIDCPPGLSQSAAATLRQSDEVMLVATAEVPSLRNLVRYLEALARLDFPAEHIHVILNRYTKRSGIADDQIEKAIRTRISLRVPNDYPEISRAINTGTPVPLDRRSEFTTALERLAKVVVPVTSATPNGRSETSLANRLFAMKKVGK